MLRCVKCEGYYGQVEGLRLMQAGFSSVECAKCVKANIDRLNQQWERYMNEEGRVWEYREHGWN